MKKLITACSIVLFCGNLLAQDSLKWNNYKKNNYSIKYPETWQLDLSGQFNTSFILLSEQETETDSFRENINLLIQDISAYNLTLADYVKLSEEQVKNMITNSIIIENKRITNAKGEYQHIIYTGTQGKLNLRFEQYYWVLNKKAYILTFTCELESKKEMKAIGEQILTSFNLLK